MSNSFFGNNLSKLEKIKLAEFQEKQAEGIDIENRGVESTSEWAFSHGAKQNEQGEWEV